MTSEDRPCPRIGLLERFESHRPGFAARQQVGEWIASGDDADVHGRAGDPSTVIKLTECRQAHWLEIGGILRKFMVDPHPAVVPVLDFGVVHVRSGTVAYFTVMERLRPITDEGEGEAVCTLLDSVWRPGDVDVAAFSGAVDVLGAEASSRLLRNMGDLPFSCEDVHWGNVMRDGTGEFRLIDIESLQYKV